MTRFDVLKAISGVKQFSLMIYEITRGLDTPEDIASFLAEELTEQQLQTVNSVAAVEDYPLIIGNRR